MKQILFMLFIAIGLSSCGSHSQNAQKDANANTQNPIMPIAFVGENTPVVLTDYLPVLSAEDEVKFITEPSYQVTKITDDGLILILYLARRRAIVRSQSLLADEG